jgi:hypothetical protein
VSVILGLDLSTRAAAAVAVPTDWDGQWSRVRWTVAGEALRKGATEAERIERCRRVADHLARFAREVGAAHAWVESYAYNMRSSAHTLGELGGIVRLGLMPQAIRLDVANMSSARKLMLGRVPRGADPKELVQATLQAAGAPLTLTSDADVCDGFTCANWGLSELGGFCFAQAEAA